MSRVLAGLEEPIVLAPLAGGPSTPALAAAVSNAGGLGMLAGAYRSVNDLQADLAAARGATAGPLGLNLFVPGRSEAPEEEIAAYAARLAAAGARYGATPGTPRADDDGWAAKLELAATAGVEVLSLTFGCPAPGELAPLRATGCELWVTVNSPEEARAAAVAGADALVVQGIEAGGHQGGWLGGDDPPRYGLLALLRLCAAAVDLPLVAAGGLTDGPAVAAALAAGASAAQAGSAFLRADEAGTDPAYRAALAAGGPTVLTHVFSGRTARGLRNRFTTEQEGHAPRAFPAVQQLTAPLRAAARAAGDAEGLSLWAGQNIALAGAGPAGEIVRRLARDARETLAQTARRVGGQL